MQNNNSIKTEDLYSMSLEKLVTLSQSKEGYKLSFNQKELMRLLIKYKRSQQKMNEKASLYGVALNTIRKVKTDLLEVYDETKNKKVLTSLHAILDFEEKYMLPAKKEETNNIFKDANNNIYS